MIRLELPLPCRLNRYFMPFGRAIKLSPDARANRKLLIAEIYHQLGGRPEPITDPCVIQITITPRSGKSHLPDIDAYCKALLDAMTKAGVWEDDRLAEKMVVDRLSPKAPGGVLIEVWPIRA